MLRFATLSGRRDWSINHASQVNQLRSTILSVNSADLSWPVLSCCVMLPGKGARAASLNEDEALLVKGLGLLTLKPLIYAANVSEDDLGNHGANNVHVQVRRAHYFHAAPAVGPANKNRPSLQHASLYAPAQCWNTSQHTPAPC